jgi:hypothetical protein
VQYTPNPSNFNGVEATEIFNTTGILGQKSLWCEDLQSGKGLEEVPRIGG